MRVSNIRYNGDCETYQILGGEAISIDLKSGDSVEIVDVEGDQAAVFDRNINGWVTIPDNIKLPNNQQERDMIARELLVKFQMSENHPMVDLNNAYRKF